MKTQTFLFILTGLLLLSGCRSSMQIVSLQCSNVPRQDTVMIAKDSTLEMIFYFYGRNGSAHVAISNSGGKPVFIDKKNSFIATDNRKINFWNDVSQVNGNLSLNQYRSVFPRVNEPFNGTISKTDRVDMIPPHSIMTIDPQIALHYTKFNMSRFKTHNDTVAASWTAHKRTVIRSTSFSSENSPSSCRFFLTVSSTEDFKAPKYYDFTFWVSDIMEMDVRQGTGAYYAYDYDTGVYGLIDKGEKAKYHSYKKAWRYYLMDTKNH